MLHVEEYSSLAHDASVSTTLCATHKTLKVKLICVKLTFNVYYLFAYCNNPQFKTLQDESFRLSDNKSRRGDDDLKTL